MMIAFRRSFYAPFLSATFILRPTIITTTAAANNFVSAFAPPPSGCSRQGTAAFYPSSLQSSSRYRTTTATSTTKMSSSNTDTEPTKKKPIVQYIVLRRDLDWPAGAMAAQAAHASVAAIAQALSRGEEDATHYISPENLPHMTKYVYGVDTLEQLEQVRDKWREQFPIVQQQQASTDNPSSNEEASLRQPDGSYYWWVEQPENIPSAFATWPVERTNKVSKAIKNMKLIFF